MSRRMDDSLDPEMVPTLLATHRPPIYQRALRRPTLKLPGHTPLPTNPRYAQSITTQAPSGHQSRVQVYQATTAQHRAGLDRKGFTISHTEASMHKDASTTTCFPMSASSPRSTPLAVFSGPNSSTHSSPSSFAPSRASYLVRGSM